MEKIIKEFSIELIHQIHNNFVENKIDNTEYFHSVKLILKSIDQFFLDKISDTSLIDRIKKDIIDVSFNLFKVYWISQAKQSSLEDEYFEFNEATESENCHNEFFEWFKK